MEYPFSFPFLNSLIQEIHLMMPFQATINNHLTQLLEDTYSLRMHSLLYSSSFKAPYPLQHLQHHGVYYSFQKKLHFLLIFCCCSLFLQHFYLFLTIFHFAFIVLLFLIIISIYLPILIK